MASDEVLGPWLEDINKTLKGILEALKELKPKEKAPLKERKTRDPKGIEKGICQVCGIKTAEEWMTYCLDHYREAHPR